LAAFRGVTTAAGFQLCWHGGILQADEREITVTASREAARTTGEPPDE
jgi:hypothetical protein